MSATLTRQAIEIARKDLLVEARVGEALRTTVPFGASALLLLPLALGTRLPLLREVGWGAYWAVVLLFGLLVTVRRSAVDGPAQSELLALLGVDPAARFLGRCAVTAALVLAFEVLLLPAAILFYDADPAGLAWLGLLAPLVAIGLACIGTVVSSLASTASAGVSLGPLLIVPLSLPLLLAATQTLEGLRYGRSSWPWLLLLFTTDLTMALAGLLTARPLEELSR